MSKPTLTEPQLEELAAMGSTDQDIRKLLDLADTPFRVSYVKSIAKGRARLRQSLRKAQLKCALKGNPTMLIFLGKVYLGQKEVSNIEGSLEHKAISITPNVLERLQTSYRLTMERLRVGDARTRDDAPDPPGGAGGGPTGDGDGVLKAAQLTTNEQHSNGESIAVNGGTDE